MYRIAIISLGLQWCFKMKKLIPSNPSQYFAVIFAAMVEVVSLLRIHNGEYELLEVSSTVT